MNEIWVWSTGTMIPTDSATPKYPEKCLSQCHFIHHKSDIWWQGRVHQYGNLSKHKGLNVSPNSN